MTLRLLTKEFRPSLRAFSSSSKAEASNDPLVKRYQNSSLKTASQRPELEVFKTINQLSREKLWNGLEHKPVRLLFGEKARRVYGVYDKLYNPRYQRFSEKWANGKEIEVIVRLFVFVLLVQGFITLYNTFVPDEIRYKYKYGLKQKFEEKNKHGDENHHH